ncbi:MAG: FecR domain-containing protein [Anaerolineae bacterium]|nr:FecR domain-containing protein [Anaerolineae bacterium]
MEVRERNVERLLQALTKDLVRPRPGFKARVLQALAQTPPVPGWRRLLLSPVFAGVAAALLILGGAWLLTPRAPARGTFTLAEGTAYVVWERPILLNWVRRGERQAAPGESIPVAEGDRIVTGAGGAGTLAFFDESTVQMQPGTTLWLAEVQPASSDAPLAIRLYVTSGEVRARVPHLLTGEDRFQVETQAALVRAWGTVLRARVISADHVYAATDKGVTLVTLLDETLGNPTVEVPAGYEVDVRVGQPLEVRPQMPVLESLQVEGELLAPTGSLVSPRAGLALIGATDPGKMVILYADPEHREMGRMQADTNGAFVIPYRAQAEGAQALCLVTEDAAGRQSDCTDYTIVYDATPPLLRLLSPTDPVVSTSEVTLRGETERGAGVTVNGDSVPVAGSGAFQATVSLSAGENAVELIACDGAGNCVTLQFTLVRE